MVFLQNEREKSILTNYVTKNEKHFSKIIFVK